MIVVLKMTSSFITNFSSYDRKIKKEDFALKELSIDITPCIESKHSQHRR